VLGVDGNVVVQANTGTARTWTYGYDGTLIVFQTTSAGNAIIQSTYNIQMNVAGNHWTFGIDGNTAFP